MTPHQKAAEEIARAFMACDPKYDCKTCSERTLLISQALAQAEARGMERIVKAVEKVYEKTRTVGGHTRKWKAVEAARQAMKGETV